MKVFIWPYWCQWQVLCSLHSSVCMCVWMLFTHIDRCKCKSVKVKSKLTEFRVSDEDPQQGNEAAGETHHPSSRAVTWHEKAPHVSTSPLHVTAPPAAQHPAPPHEPTDRPPASQRLTAPPRSVTVKADHSCRNTLRPHKHVQLQLSMEGRSRLIH